MNKLLIICGPTATGKTQLGVILAKKFNGEIISADSRQVYKGMDIGTGKDIPKISKLKSQNSKLQIENSHFTVGYREKDEIPIWLVDVCKPDYRFNVGEYRELAQKVINYLWSQNKLPIVVGGTGLYLKSLIEPLSNMGIPPNPILRKQLTDMTRWGLQIELQQVDSNKWEAMNESDRKNSRRLVRAIEIAEWKKVHLSSQPTANSLQQVDTLLIGLTMNKEELLNKIDARVEARVKTGIVEEIQDLLNQGYSWDLSAMSGMGYKEWEPLFENQKTKIQNPKLEQEIISKWKIDEHDYVKRQIAWFKKIQEIQWFEITKPNWYEDVSAAVTTWYNLIHES